MNTIRLKGNESEQVVNYKQAIERMANTTIYEDVTIYDEGSDPEFLQKVIKELKAYDFNVVVKTR